jgi:acetylxylan esterase
MTRGYQAAAEKSGFIILYPSSKRDYNCWDVATNETLTHDGGGDSNGLANILRWTVTKYNADPAKLFVTGSSSGCMMSNVMSAVYPDLITAASCYSGVAAGCVAGSPGSSPQSADPACANGQHIKTGAAWAAQARAMFPAWNGSYPRFTTWHGTADTLVLYANLGEQIKEWTTLLGVRFTRNITDSPQSGYTQMVYGDGTKFVAFSAQGVGHTVPIHEDYDLKWFGLA